MIGAKRGIQDTKCGLESSLTLQVERLSSLYDLGKTIIELKGIQRYISFQDPLTSPFRFSPLIVVEVNLSINRQTVLGQSQTWKPAEHECANCAIIL